MKKYIAIITSLIILQLIGCSDTSSIEMTVLTDENASGAEISVTPDEITPETETPENAPINTTSTNISQVGPYGEIAITLPDGWSYELCPVDSDRLLNGMYGIIICPDGVNDNRIEIGYTESFGVCGVGLSEEMATIAGEPAYIGTFDDNEYWDFIAFRGGYDGIVVLSYSEDNRLIEYDDQIMDILETLSFDKDVKEGGAYIYNEDSEISEIALYVSLKNISPTGATIVFNQYNADVLKGELICGEDYVLEVQKNGSWEAAPIVLEGEYGFHDIAYMIASEDVTEMEINWEWLYGTLEPGEYRVVKSVDDIIESGNFEKYTVYVSFVLN